MLHHLQQKYENKKKPRNYYLKNKNGFNNIIGLKNNDIS